MKIRIQSTIINSYNLGRGLQIVRMLENKDQVQEYINDYCVAGTKRICNVDEAISVAREQLVQSI